MPKIIDITNQRFGRLITIKIVGKTNCLHTLWLCRCDCGTEKAVSSNKLRRGDTVSCGCGKLDGHLRRTHGAAAVGRETREYGIWKAMLQRCNNPNNKDFKFYGGRGITVCDRWSWFENFIADMGPKPEGYSIERKNNNGNYEPDNCKWATHSEQMKNKRYHATDSMNC
jgi:hypothetical protein